MRAYLVIYFTLLLFSSFYKPSEILFVGFGEKREQIIGKKNTQNTRLAHIGSVVSFLYADRIFSPTTKMATKYGVSHNTKWCSSLNVMISLQDENSYPFENSIWSN